MTNSPTNLIVKYVKLSPSGNITTLVLTPISRVQHAAAASQIMQRQPDVEQVGFIEPSTHPEAATRLQMMGGEFCGNATSALAWMLFKKNNFQQGNIEVSGKTEPAFASIVDNQVELEFATLFNMYPDENSAGRIIIGIEGITHVICPEPPPSDASTFSLQMLQDLGLTKLEASGVIFVQSHLDGIAITPYVWVRETGSLTQESACASGSICAAIWQSVIRKSEAMDLPIYQPSGSIIYVSTKIINGAIAKTRFVSRVEILEENVLALHV